LKSNTTSNFVEIIYFSFQQAVLSHTHNIFATAKASIRK